MQRLLLFVFTAALLAASAHAVTVRVTQLDGSRVQIALHPGDVLRVDLPSDPAGGRLWKLRGHTPAQLVELGATQRVFGGRMSDQGASSFAWRALNPGEATLTLAYGTASARAEQPEKTYTVALTVASAPLGPEEQHPAPISQLEPVAAYERTEPCADCSARTERLLLYRAPGETPYVLRRTYKDAPGGTLTSITTGSWSTHPGAFADPSAVIYELSSGSEASVYQLDGDRLVPVDTQQIPVPSPPGIDNAFHKVGLP